MPVTITWPSDTTEVIDAIRDAIGRNITINVTVSGIACSEPGCDLNPVTNLSTNQYCEVCHGLYWINTASGMLVNAHVTWKPSDTPVWITGGNIIEGDCLIQIKYSATILGLVNDATNFIVDGKTLLKDSVILRGTPDINRILITLEEQEE
jgi:hypothetical protein